MHKNTPRVDYTAAQRGEQQHFYDARVRDQVSQDPEQVVESASVPPNLEVQESELGDSEKDEEDIDIAQARIPQPESSKTDDSVAISEIATYSQTCI